MADTIAAQNADKFLDELMLENHITVNDVYTCFERHKNEIWGMTNIFKHKDADAQRLSLESLGLMGQDQGNKVMEFYCREYGWSQPKFTCGNFPRGDVVLLLTACFYNPAFFSFALSVSEDIKSRLTVGVPKVIIGSRNNKRTFIKKSEHSVILETADSPRWEKVFDEKAIYCDNIGGNFEFMGRAGKEAQIRFIFDEPQATIPFELEICFTTICDQKEHRLLADIPDVTRKGITFIKSSPASIDHDNRIESYEIYSLPPKDKQVGGV